MHDDPIIPHYTTLNAYWSVTENSPLQRKIKRPNWLEENLLKKQKSKKKNQHTHKGHIQYTRKLPVPKIRPVHLGSRPAAQAHWYCAGNACGHCTGHTRKFFQGHVNIPDAFGYKQASKLESGNSIWAQFSVAMQRCLSLLAYLSCVWGLAVDSIGNCCFPWRWFHKNYRTFIVQRCSLIMNYFYR